MEWIDAEYSLYAIESNECPTYYIVAESYEAALHLWREVYKFTHVPDKVVRLSGPGELVVQEEEVE